MLATNPSPYQHSHNYKMAAPTNARDARIAELLSNLDLLNNAPRNNKPFPKPVVYEQEDEAEEDDLERTLPGPVEFRRGALARSDRAAANMLLPPISTIRPPLLCAEVMAQAGIDPVELGALVGRGTCVAAGPPDAASGRRARTRPPPFAACAAAATGSTMRLSAQNTARPAAACRRQ